MLRCQAPPPRLRRQQQAHNTSGGALDYKRPEEVLPASQIAAIETSEAQRLAEVVRNAKPGPERVEALEKWLKVLHK